MWNLGAPGKRASKSRSLYKALRPMSLTRLTASGGSIVNSPRLPTPLCAIQPGQAKHPFTVLDWNWKKRGRWKRAPTRSKATEMLRQASAKIAPTERNSSFCRLSCGSTSRALAERLGAIISKAPTNDYDSTLTGNKGPLVSPFFRTLLGQERGAPPGESGSGG